MNIPTPHLDELKRLAKLAEDYAAENDAELNAEVAAIKEEKLLAQERGQEVNGALHAMPDPEP